jgi:hypothetical protein
VCDITEFLDVADERTKTVVLLASEDDTVGKNFP